MTELIFIVEEDVEGGFTARAIGAPIFTEAETLEELRRNVREAVECHFEQPKDRPKIVRLHVTRDEVLTL
jgi:predicted RNase H-like HicB family nuclease